MIVLKMLLGLVVIGGSIVLTTWVGKRILMKWMGYGDDVMENFLIGLVTLFDLALVGMLSYLIGILILG